MVATQGSTVDKRGSIVVAYLVALCVAELISIERRVNSSTYSTFCQ